MFEVLTLAVALSMDAFAISIGLGSQHLQKTKSLAIRVAIYFGLFQAIMPLIGFLGGKSVLGWVEGYAHWIVFLLLILIGSKMIYESITEGVEENIAQINHKILLVLAIATSIDAMAAGFTLTLIEINPLIACTIMGITSFFLSGLGVFIGAKSGAWLESKAELFGGIVLILIGFKILAF
ncbi:manganese efflux pump [Nitrosomonas sp. HPC101]|uniref:manganese efflux pump MntP n=1 Tax=Nitrosomonas sp. HPC101 TaxID=1658667 RepID=UPI0013689677|nr:manganese efflux pump MntP family protein [Nitrosomonas sp. HPC101]MXS85690.1 manganese efflux pump [Nitrosomonas sp. HPC101]